MYHTKGCKSFRIRFFPCSPSFPDLDQFLSTFIVKPTRDHCGFLSLTSLTYCAVLYRSYRKWFNSYCQILHILNIAKNLSIVSPCQVLDCTFLPSSGDSDNFCCKSFFFFRFFLNLPQIRFQISEYSFVIGAYTGWGIVFVFSSSYFQGFKV